MSVICHVCLERLRMMIEGVPFADLIRCEQHPVLS